MGIRRTEEFRNKDIRIALTSGLLLKQVATILAWVFQHWVNGSRAVNTMS